MMHIWHVHFLSIRDTKTVTKSLPDSSVNFIVIVGNYRSQLYQVLRDLRLPPCTVLPPPRLYIYQLGKHTNLHIPAYPLCSYLPLLSHNTLALITVGATVSHVCTLQAEIGPSAVHLENSVTWLISRFVITDTIWKILACASTANQNDWQIPSQPIQCSDSFCSANHSSVECGNKNKRKTKQLPRILSGKQKTAMV